MQAGRVAWRTSEILAVVALAASLTSSLVFVLGLTGSGSVAAAVGEDEPASVVVTTEVLGDLVRELVGDSADVTVLMAGGANPHTYEPSARDAERILHADLVVSNGLDLEEGLRPVLEMTGAEGVAWFQAADHVELRELEGAEDHGDAADHADEPGEDEHGHGVDPTDPHIWTDPLAMRDVVVALAAALAEQGVDVGGRGAELAADLEALDGEVAAILAAVPEGRRKLVTGHRSLGYFADRYGFEPIGTVIPSLSTSGEPSARELAALIADIRESDVPVVFVEVGTPQSVARAVADDSGAALVELSAVRLPEDGSYRDLILDMATTIAGALGE